MAALGYNLDELVDIVHDISIVRVSTLDGYERPFVLNLCSIPQVR